MNTDTQLKVQAYLDEELSALEASQVASHLASDPAARALYQRLKETKETMAENELPVTLPESREFYWSKIERAIAATPSRSDTAPSVPWWLRLLLPAAGALALLALLVSLNRPASDPTLATLSALTSSRPAGHQAETPYSDVSTYSFRSEGMMVVWVASQ